MLKQVALWSPLNTEVIYQTFLSFPQPYTSKIPDFQMTSCSERRFFFLFLFWPQQCPSVSITPIRLGLNAFLMLHIITCFPWTLHFPLCPLRIISIGSEEHSLYSWDHLLPISPSPSVKRAGDPELYSKVFSKEPCFELLQVCPGCWVPQLFVEFHSYFTSWGTATTAFLFNLCVYSDGKIIFLPLHPPRSSQRVGPQGPPGPRGPPGPSGKDGIDVSATWQREGGGGAEAEWAEQRSAACPPEPLGRAAEVVGCGECTRSCSAMARTENGGTERPHSCRIYILSQESSG